MARRSKKTPTPVVELADTPVVELTVEAPAPRASRSVVKERYKAKYAPTKDRCGDALAEQLSTHCWDVEADCIDTAKLRRFADANGLWIEKYARLNPGMQRMNVSNRLRGAIRRNPEFEVVWA
jgi:hypothetical protein